MSSILITRVEANNTLPVSDFSAIRVTRASVSSSGTPVSAIRIARTQVTSTSSMKSAIYISEAYAKNQGSTSALRIVRSQVSNSTGIYAKVSSTQLYVRGLDSVLLDGTNSTGNIAGYQWRQESGPIVTIENSNTPIAKFTAPGIPKVSTDLRFSLTVRDAAGFSSQPTYVTVSVARHRTFRSLPGGGYVPYKPIATKPVPVAIDSAIRISRVSVNSTGNVTPTDPPPVTDNFIVGTTKPDATNTGPRTQPYKVHDGDWRITTPGVYENYIVTGFVTIAVDGVTFRDNLVKGRFVPDSNARILIYVAATTYVNTVIEFNEVYYEPVIGATTQDEYVASRVYDVNGIQAQSGLMQRNRVHHVSDTGLIWQNNCRVVANYYHNNIHVLQDPNWNGNPSHDDGLQIQGGDAHLVWGNNIEGANNSAIQITQDVSVTTNLTIKENWLGRGQATVNFAEKGKGPFIGLKLLNNRFFRKVGGYQILIADTTRYDPSVTIAGNVWEDTGQPVPISRGG